MSDPEIITDGYGTPLFKKPIFQCDLADEKRGFTDFGLVNGMGYNLGEDTGITILPAYLRNMSTTYNGTSQSFYRDGKFSEIDLTLTLVLDYSTT